MTVRQLIDLLQGFPNQEAEVLVETPDGDQVTAIKTRHGTVGGSDAIVIETED